jgi:hypothetical protein
VDVSVRSFVVSGRQTEQPKDEGAPIPEGIGATEDAGMRRV